jgi:hypothetical protein
MLTLDDVARDLAEESHCRRFLGTWMKWRGQRVVPVRDDALPEDLGAALPALAILEVEARDRVTIRIAASDAMSLTGQKLKGANLLDLTRPEDRAARMVRLWQLVTTPCGVLTDAHLILKSGMTCPMRSLILPVTAAADTAPRLLYIVTDFSEAREPGPGDKAHIIPLSETYRFVDIGAGVPDS